MTFGQIVLKYSLKRFNVFTIEQYNCLCGEYNSRVTQTDRLAQP